MSELVFAVARASDGGVWIHENGCLSIFPKHSDAVKLATELGNPWKVIGVRVKISTDSTLLFNPPAWAADRVSLVEEVPV